jgi:hypothetical protein
MIRNKVFVLITITAFAYSLSVSGQRSRMVYGEDDPLKEWCYLSKSTTVIGVPFVPQPVQVTFDGSVFTGNTELCFFYDDSIKPILIRQKSFLNGWIPIVSDSWQHNNICYDIEIFSASLDPIGSENSVQFIRYRMKNSGNETATGTLATAIRGSARDYRKGNPIEYTPETEFRITNNSFYRDNRFLYSFSNGGKCFAVPEEIYSKPYTAADYNLTSRAETGIVVYRKELDPGEEYSVVFKMPRLPIAEEAMERIIAKADYNITKQQVIKNWEKLIDERVSFSIPEKRVNDSYKAALVHLILATRGNGSVGNRQGSGLPYDELFLNDYFDMLLAYEAYGLTEFIEPNIEWLMKKQHKSGMFIDVHNRGDDSIVTSHGQGLFSLAYHYVMTRDNKYGEKIYPAIRKGVDLIINDHKTDKYGLIRPSIPYDAPMVSGYHTCHNLFALTALQTSIRVARLMGQEEDADAWTKAQKSYKKSIIKAIDNAYQKEGYITSGLYDWTAGLVQGRLGVNEYPNQDWENNLLCFPSELLSINDIRVAKTLETIRKRKYREGCMTYRNGMHIHQYVTINQAHQYMVTGDQKHALLDLYHVLLHNGSTHEGFENLVEPWSRTVYAGCPPPHAWAAAKTALFIRNMMVMEYGGEGGVNENERDLLLFSLISPDWIETGKKLEIKNAPTEMGNISASMLFTDGGASIKFDAEFHNSPRHIIFRIPYFLELKSADAEGKIINRENDILYLSPDIKKLTLSWTKKSSYNENIFQEILKSYRKEYGFVKNTDDYKNTPPKPFLLDDEQNIANEPLSFIVVKKAFKKEYERRCSKLKKEGILGRVKAPPLLTPEERETLYQYKH